MRKFFLYLCIPLILSLLIFLLLFQEKPAKFNVVIVPKKFKISIPEYLSKTNDADTTSALMQYSNEKKQLFLLILREENPTNQPLEVTFKIFSSVLMSKIEHGNLIKYYPEKIDGYNAFIGNIRGSANQTAIYYRIAVIDVDNIYYELIFGSSDNSQPAYDDDMNTCIRSIHFHY